jgi:6,7-dimethyl-8-ribityllumazine synthase
MEPVCNLSVYDKTVFLWNIFVLSSLFEWNEAITEGYTMEQNKHFRKQGSRWYIIRWNVPKLELIYGCKNAQTQKKNVDAVTAIGSVIQGN